MGKAIRTALGMVASYLPKHSLFASFYQRRDEVVGDGFFLVRLPQDSAISRLAGVSEWDARRVVVSAPRKVAVM
jgi:hypothetical protein